MPPGLQPKKLEAFEQPSHQTAGRPGVRGVPRAWLGFAIAGLGAIGTTAAVIAWLVFH